MQIQFAAGTDVGQVREHNEDNYLVDKKLQLYVVADGMGGHSSGEIASALAVNIVRENVLKNQEMIDEYIAGQPTVTRRDILALLEHSIQHACYRIFEKGLNNPRQRGMGTTLTAMLIVGGRGFLGHVGDSRLYLVRQSQVHQLTEDHSLLNELLKHGKVKNLKDIDQRFKNAVTRAVGVYESVEVDTLDFDILPGDRFMLCSDGLHGYLDNDLILEKARTENLQVAVTDFVDYANKKGGKDNITCILLQAVDSDDGDYTDVKLKFDTLRRLVLFRYLNYQELVRVMNIASEQHWEPGHTIFKEGQEEDCLYVLVRGEVEIRKGDTCLASLRDGAHFGEMSLVDKSPRSADAICVAPSVALVVSRRDFYEVLRKNSALAVKMLWSFIKSLSARLRSTSEELSQIKAQFRSYGELSSADDELVARWLAPVAELDIGIGHRSIEDVEGGADTFPPELLPLTRFVMVAKAARTTPPRFGGADVAGTVKSQES